MITDTDTQQESTSPFVLPRTLDEIMVSLVFVAWPLIFIFILHRNMDTNAFGEAVAWICAFAIQVGILFALRNARRHR